MQQWVESIKKLDIKDHPKIVSKKEEKMKQKSSFKNKKSLSSQPTLIDKIREEDIDLSREASKK